MIKEMRLRDFQICTGSTGSMDSNKTVNLALFTSYEPVRLWFKERKIKAPFVKLVVNMTNEASRARLEGLVTVAIGICEAHIAVDFSTLLQRAADHHWVLGRVLHALGYVDQTIG